MAQNVRFYIFSDASGNFSGGFQEKISMLFEKISMVFQKISMVFQKISNRFEKARPRLRFFLSRMKKKYAGIFQNNHYSAMLRADE